MVVAELESPSRAGVPVFGDAGCVSGDAGFEALGPDVRRARVFAGLAGWGPGQPEMELEREGGSFALLARMPLDPSLN